jgi:uncharacterized protein
MLKKAQAVLCCALLSISLLAGKAFAQQPNSDEKKALIQELLLVTDAGKMASSMVDSTLTALDKQYPLMIKEMMDEMPELTPAQKKKLNAEVRGFAWFSQTFRERMQKRINFKELIEKISYPLYDKYFTESELKDLIAFYKSSTGQKTLMVMPSLFADSMQKSGEILTPVFTEMIQEILEEEKARLKRKKN